MVRMSVCRFGRASRKTVVSALIAWSAFWRICKCALIASDSLLDHVSNPELIFLGNDSQIIYLERDVHEALQPLHTC
jgi:hypothetical protein